MLIDPTKALSRQDILAHLTVSEAPISKVSPLAHATSMSLLDAIEVLLHAAPEPPDLDTLALVNSPGLEAALQQHAADAVLRSHLARAGRLTHRDTVK